MVIPRVVDRHLVVDVDEPGNHVGAARRVGTAELAVHQPHAPQSRGIRVVEVSQKHHGVSASAHCGREGGERRAARPVGEDCKAHRRIDIGRRGGPKALDVSDDHTVESDAIGDPRRRRKIDQAQVRGVVAARGRRLRLVDYGVGEVAEEARLDADDRRRGGPHPDDRRGRGDGAEERAMRQDSQRQCLRPTRRSRDGASSNEPFQEFASIHRAPLSAW